MTIGIYSRVFKEEHAPYLLELIKQLTQKYFFSNLSGVLQILTQAACSKKNRYLQTFGRCKKTYPYCSRWAATVLC